MSTFDFDEAVEHYHVAQGEFLKGNPEPVKEQFSHRDDVSLANPYGPPVRGWQQVAQKIERAKAKIGAREEITPYAVRATNIFRREDGVWKMVHRHADPITTAQPAESVLQQ